MSVKIMEENKTTEKKEEKKPKMKSVDELSEKDLEDMLSKIKENKKEVPEVEVEVVKKAEEDKEEPIEEPKTEDEAQGFIQGLFNYIKNPNFEKKIVDESQRSGLDKRQVANNFAMRILGTISDLIHLGLDTIQDAFSTLTSILAGLLIKGGELIVRCAKRIVRMVTLNQTAKAE